MMNKLKNNFKVIISFIVGVMLSGGLVYAATSANKVTYTTDKNTNINSVAEALDDLYSNRNKIGIKDSITIPSNNETYYHYNCGFQPSFVLVNLQNANDSCWIYKNSKPFSANKNQHLQEDTDELTVDETGFNIKVNGGTWNIYGVNVNIYAVK